MATANSSPLLLLRPQPPLFSSRSLSPSRRGSNRRSFIPRARSVANTRKEEVVVVGAGIAGLATALSLHRLGVRSLVLEQGDLLRTGGTSLTLFKNGWRVLDSIGVGAELRSKFLQIQGLVMRSEDGRELRSFTFEEEAPGQEVRAVERRVLLETLASRLPPDTISYMSRLKGLERGGDGETLLELDDGTRILAKIVIGCDGVRSPVAKWMGFSEPRYAGHCAYRGLGIYPEGQPFKPKVNYIYGRGLRAGFVPVSATKVYWFICFNSPSPGARISEPSILKKEALELLSSWPAELLDVMEMTPDRMVVKTPLVDRWLWPGFSPPASTGNVVVVGDAWHPMTPNLGQGACCALEDAVVLAGKLAGALRSGKEVAVDEALRDYGRERWVRIFPLTARANLVGSLLQWEDPVVCGFRNNIMIPKLVRLGPFLEHTNHEWEEEERVTSNPYCRDTNCDTPGAIPALQQVMSATRGATDAFSGVGRHVNSSLRKVGVKNIEAGVGCGVGIGHGFGVGLALKPGVVHQIQSSVAQALTKILTNMGIGPSISSVQSVIPGSDQSSISMLSGTSGRNVESSIGGSVLDLASKTSGSTFLLSKSDEGFHREPGHNPYELKGTSSDTALGSRTEKVIDNFLHNPLFRKDDDMELNELAGKMRAENNVLQMLLKHHQVIEELMEENRKLRQILVEDLKVPPNKLEAGNENWNKFDYRCSDCFECRRRRRKAAR